MAEQHSKTCDCTVEQPGLSPAEIVKAAGDTWKGLTKEEKPPYLVMHFNATCAWMHVTCCMLLVLAMAELSHLRGA